MLMGLAHAGRDVENEREIETFIEKSFLLFGL
jgi:hypothetical protein